MTWVTLSRYFYLDFLQKRRIVCKPQVDHPNQYFTSWWGKYTVFSLIVQTNLFKTENSKQTKLMKLNVILPCYQLAGSGFKKPHTYESIK